MQAVITVFDDPDGRVVQDIWGELERDFGVRATSVHVPVPHITYQGAASYDRDRLDGILHQVARETEPFTVVTDGLGLFSGPTLVLYVPVVRSPALTQLHQRVWQAITTAGTGTTLVYAPE